MSEASLLSEVVDVGRLLLVACQCVSEARDAATQPDQGEGKREEDARLGIHSLHANDTERLEDLEDPEHGQDGAQNEEDGFLGWHAESLAEDVQRVNVSRREAHRARRSAIAR